MTSWTADEIRHDLELAIRTGKLGPGDRLDPVRRVAGDLGVSPTTAASAYRQLRERGLVVGRGRQGTVVAPRQGVLTRASAMPSPGTIDAMSGNPDPRFLPPLDAAFAAAVRVAGHDVYGGPLHDDSFVAVARRLFADDGVPAHHLAVTSGGMDAVQRVIASLDVRPGARIGVEDPGHAPVHNVVRTAGLEPVSIRVDAQGVTADGLGAALTRGLAAIVVTPRAQNPTGAALTRERAAELEPLLADHPQTAVILDDHAGAVAGADHVGLHSPDARWATVRSLGKYLGPDIRVAAVVGDAHTIAHVNDTISDGPGWVSHILQRAAAHLLDSADVLALIDDATRSYARRRKRMIDALSSESIDASGRSGINVWVPVADEQGAVDAARRAGCSIRAGASYRIASPPAVRITVSALDDAEIDRLAATLGEALRERRAPHV